MAGAVERLLRRDRAIVIGAVGLLFGLAGIYTLLGVGMEMSALRMTAMRAMRDMPGAHAPGEWSMGHGLLVLAMWWVMMVAMMLPSVAPAVLLYAALLRRTAAAARVPVIAALFLGGYLAVWGLFSAGATLAQWGLEASGAVSAGMMTLTGGRAGGVVLIAAGVYQFTPMKAACLRQCRSPGEFIAAHRRPGARGAFVMGLGHGAYCLGCCWVLMALLFVGGIMNLYWIVGLAGFVALEKLTRFGVAAGRIAGAGLMIWGAYALAG